MLVARLEVAESVALPTPEGVSCPKLPVEVDEEGEADVSEALEDGAAALPLDEAVWEGDEPDACEVVLDVSLLELEEVGSPTGTPTPVEDESEAEAEAEALVEVAVALPPAPPLVMGADVNVGRGVVLGVPRDGEAVEVSSAVEESVVDDLVVEEMSAVDETDAEVRVDETSSVPFPGVEVEGKGASALGVLETSLSTSVLKATSVVELLEGVNPPNRLVIWSTRPDAADPMDDSVVLLAGAEVEVEVSDVLDSSVVEEVRLKTLAKERVLVVVVDSGSVVEEGASVIEGVSEVDSAAEDEAVVLKRPSTRLRMGSRPPERVEGDAVVLAGVVLGLKDDSTSPVLVLEISTSSVVVMLVDALLDEDAADSDSDSDSADEELERALELANSLSLEVEVEEADALVVVVVGSGTEELAAALGDALVAEELESVSVSTRVKAAGEEVVVVVVSKENRRRALLDSSELVAEAVSVMLTVVPLRRIVSVTRVLASKSLKSWRLSLS